MASTSKGTVSVDEIRQRKSAPGKGTAATKGRDGKVRPTSGSGTGAASAAAAAKKGALDEKFERSKKLKEQQELERKRKLEEKKAKEQQRKEAAAERRREMEEKKRQEQQQKEKRAASSSTTAGAKKTTTTKTVPTTTRTTHSAGKAPSSPGRAAHTTTAPGKTPSSPGRAAHTTTAPGKTPHSPSTRATQSAKTTTHSATSRTTRTPPKATGSPKVSAAKPASKTTTPTRTAAAKKPKDSPKTSRLRPATREPGAAKYAKPKETKTVQAGKGESSESELTVSSEVSATKPVLEDQVDRLVEKAPQESNEIGEMLQQPAVDATPAENALTPNMAVRVGQEAEGGETEEGGGEIRTGEQPEPEEDRQAEEKELEDLNQPEVEDKPTPHGPESSQQVLPEEFGVQWKQEEDERKMKEEQGRADRKKRVEEIMLRTRTKGAELNEQNWEEVSPPPGDEILDQEQPSVEPFEPVRPDEPGTEFEPPSAGQEAESGLLIDIDGGEPENQPEVLEAVPQEEPEEVPEAVPQEEPEEVPEAVPQEEPEEVPEAVPQEEPEVVEQQQPTDFEEESAPASVPKEEDFAPLSVEQPEETLPVVVTNDLIPGLEEPREEPEMIPTDEPFEIKPFETLETPALPAIPPPSLEDISQLESPPMPSTPPPSISEEMLSMQLGDGFEPDSPPPIEPLELEGEPAPPEPSSPPPIDEGVEAVDTCVKSPEPTDGGEEEPQVPAEAEGESTEPPLPPSSPPPTDKDIEPEIPVDDGAEPPPLPSSPPPAGKDMDEGLGEEEFLPESGEEQAGKPLLTFEDEEATTDVLLMLEDEGDIQQRVDDTARRVEQLEAQVIQPEPSNEPPTGLLLTTADVDVGEGEMGTGSDEDVSPEPFEASEQEATHEGREIREELLGAPFDAPLGGEADILQPSTEEVVPEEEEEEVTTPKPDLTSWDDEATADVATDDISR